MFGIKTKIISNIDKTLSVKTNKMPANGNSLLKIRKRFYDIQKEYSKQSTMNNLGWLNTPPKKLGVWAYKYFLCNNQNHLGNWSKRKPFSWGTQNLEKEVIHMLTDLYHGSKSKLEGYVTSGGTEGNLFSIWTGRKFLNSKNIPTSKLCIVQTDLTHYSIRKNADIANIDLITTPLNSKSWNMDPNGLIETIKNSYSSGYRGFIIPLTLGYTETGTSDEILSITKTISQFKKSYNNVSFYVWIDAAFSGLTEPFVNDKFKPFASSLIQTFVVDFHKFGGVPYPAGVVLYRRHLRNLIEKEISYLPEKDSTISGSRPGAPAAAIWTTIMSFGEAGFKQIVTDQMKNKEYFVNKLKIVVPTAKIVTSPNSLSCGVIFNNRIESKLTKNFKERFGLFTKTNAFHFYPKILLDIMIYKFYFLPHLKTKTLDKFFYNLNQIINI